MGRSSRRIALGGLVAGALLCVSSRNLRAEDPADSSSAAVPAMADTSRTVDASNAANPSDAPKGPADTPQQSDPAAGAGSAAPSGNAAAAVAQKGFWARFAQAYGDDWRPSASSNAAPKYRGFPMPEGNPPYSFNEWPIGGTVWIGYPNATSYPLTTALYGSQHWQWLKKSNIQIYGWANAGMNLSASTQAEGGEYGTLGTQYGADPVMFYLDFYFPHVAEGMILRVDRYISFPDIEAQLAPNNYTYTHSLTSTYDCYTQTGANATIKLSS